MCDGKGIITKDNISMWDSEETTVLNLPDGFSAVDRRRDLIRKVTLEPDKEFLINLEFQQYRDKFMTLRMLVCLVMNLQNQMENKPKELLQVVPIVLFFGSHSWTKSLELMDLCKKVEEIQKYEVNFKPIIVDINKFDTNKIKNKEVRDAFRAIQLLNKWNGNKEVFEGLVLTKESALFVSAVTKTAKLEKIVEIYKDEEEIIMCEAVDRVLKREREKSEKIGEKRGRAEGMKQGKVETLIKLLTRKFKVLSEELIEAVKQSSIEKLEQLSEDIFDVQSETDVLHILNA